MFPVAHAPITSHHLLATTNDPQGRRPITFVVATGPALGRLLLKEDQHLVSVTNFTQAQVDEGLVLYEHTRPFADLSAKDMFSFDVVTPFAKPLTRQEFHLDISVASSTKGGALEQYLGLAPLLVAEGSEAALTQENLNISAVEQLLKLLSSKGVGTGMGHGAWA